MEHSQQSSERPTRVRHLVVGVTVGMAVLLYLDRFCVSFAERYIREDLSLTNAEMARFLSAFFWSYAVAQVPAGWLGDRYGARGVLALYILTWSFFTAMIGLAGGIVSLLAMRAGCGLAQAGAYPASGSLLSRWVPFSNRGLASALVSLGGRMGGALAPPLTAYMMVLFVPLSTPATLDATTLRDAVAVCARLVPSSAPDSPSQEKDSRDSARVESRLWHALPARVQSIVVQVGRAAQALERRREALVEEDRSIDQVQGEPAALQREIELIDEKRKGLHLTPAEIEDLLGAINSTLADPGLFSDSDLAPLRSLETEALGLLARRTGDEGLSAREGVRLNRLVLEAVFPAEVGKLYVRGWRPVLIVYGAAGIVVAAVFWISFRNSPAEHPRCNALEQALVAEGGPVRAAGAAPPGPLPLGRVLSSGSLWLSSVSQFGTNLAWLFFVTWLPRYLMEVHRVPILERSWMTSIPPLAGIAGMFLGGWLTDRLTRRLGRRFGRALPMGLTKLLAAMAYLACLWVDSPWLATAAFAIGFFCVDLGVSSVWAFMQDVGGRHVGAILGWGNMWGNIGAALAPELYNQILGSTPGIADWNRMFVVCAGVFLVSGVAALGIDASKPIAEAAPALEPGPADGSRS